MVVIQSDVQIVAVAMIAFGCLVLGFVIGSIR